MSNVLSDEKREQVLALGRLGWPLRRIEATTGVRRETASAYLKAAGVAIRAPRTRRPPKPASEVISDSGPPPALEELGMAAMPVAVGRAPTANACEPYRELIESAVAAGRTALSIWQDLAEQPGFRTGTGCPAPGQTAPSFAQMTLWRLLSGTRFDVSIRDGVRDPGTGVTVPFVLLGTSISALPWPTRPDCTIWSSADVGYLLPGVMNTQGSYDGSLQGLPVLPPGYRLWCQAGSISLATGDLAFGDATTLITPPPGPLPIPTSRIANSTDHTGATGVVSYAVPVMGFF